MTTIKLSDGTTVPTHYDFNEHFDPLPVHDQGRNPICWFEGHASLLEAFYRMYEGKDLHLDAQRLGDEDASPTAKRWTDERTGADLGTVDYAGDNLWNLPGYKDMPRRDAIAKALWLNGVLEGGVTCQHSFDRLWLHPAKYKGYSLSAGRFLAIPVLGMLKGDRARSWSHEVFYPGYDWDRGLLVQNSWGNRFGYHGRAYLSWEMVEEGCIDTAFIDTYNDHPADGLVMPPVRRR